jgi:hypothetical protein
MAIFCAAAVAWQQKILCAKLKFKPFRFEPHKFVAAELTAPGEPSGKAGASQGMPAS